MEEQTLFFPIGEFNGIWSLSNENFDDKSMYFLSWDNVQSYIYTYFNTEEELNKYTIFFHNLITDQFFKLINLTSYFSGIDEQPIFWYINEEAINED